MTVDEVLEMATLGGAACLGRDDIGALEPGRACDLALFDLDDPLVDMSPVHIPRGFTKAFIRGEVVACVDASGGEVARGLVNYDALETDRIKGQPSTRFEEVLGYLDDKELIHRDNLVLL